MTSMNGVSISDEQQEWMDAKTRKDGLKRTFMGTAALEGAIDENVKGSESETIKDVKNFTHMELENALRNVDDLFARCVLDTKYFLLGDTAKAAKENGFLSGPCIEVGIEDRYLTPEVRSTLKQFGHVDNPGDNWEYEVAGVPVKVKVIHNKYDFFKHPDIKYWAYDDYQLPNPFDTYYKSRFLIK